MKRLSQKITHIKGFSPTTKIDENTALFVRTKISMFAFTRQKCQYILSMIVLKIRKADFLKKGPRSDFFNTDFCNKIQLAIFRTQNRSIISTFQAIKTIFLKTTFLRFQTCRKLGLKSVLGQNFRRLWQTIEFSVGFLVEIGQKMAQYQKNLSLDFFRQSVTKYFVNFPILSIMLKTTSDFKPIHTG